MDNKYKHFFDIDESYYPCVDESAIDSGKIDWKKTYPHKTFIELLKLTEEMLSGTTNRALWIYGKYGTGKSQCAYALKKILDVSDDELKEYWNIYPDLKDKNKDLLTKFIGHKDGNILTVWRYASGMVENSERLFRYIQESIRKSLIKNNCEYLGQKTFKDIIISWLSDKSNKDYFNNKLINFRNDTEELRKHGESFRLFCNKNVDEILNQLQSEDSEINELVENIIKLSDKIGINFSTNLDSDSLKKWIEDVIKVNNIKIVFIWDEFSDYFKKNKNSLGDFQDVVSLCQKVPFYFVMVTHDSTSYMEDNSSKKVVEQRFTKIEIKLPENIAFELIGHAFTVNKNNENNWKNAVDALNARICDSREEVKKAIKESRDKVIENIMPIHPMTALVLRYIASSFKANQRSMFDFIKTRNTDTTKAFQWFIENHGPLDYKPFLTVDMLWNFFYEKGKSDLAQNVRMVLESYPTNENFTPEEEAVLKSILIMQAIDKGLDGDVNDLLKTTAQNLKYVFEGTEEFIENPVNIAEKLVKRGILIKKTSNKKEIYVMSEFGNFQDLEKFREIIRKKKTIELVKQGELENALQLSPSLRFRLESEPGSGKLIPLTVDNFANETTKSLNKEPSKWHFETFVAFAKNEDEASLLRDKIKNFLQEKKDRDDFIIIDASLTPLGEEAFGNYVEDSAKALAYSGNNNNLSNDNNNKAKQILSSEWKSKIFDGQFVIYSKSNLYGKTIANKKVLLTELQDIILAKYRYIFDFEQGLSENVFKTASLKPSAEGGLRLPDKKTQGVINGIEKKVLPNVYNVPNYWENVATENENISIIKRKLDNKIKEEFDSNGKISIRDIVDFLESEFSFAPSSLYAFLTGFLLKEYVSDLYLYLDEKGFSEVITSEKIAEMITGYINNKNSGKYFETYISKLTDDLREFYDLTSYICDFGKKYVTIKDSAYYMQEKIKEFSLPIWGLRFADKTDCFPVLKLYMDFLKQEGNIAHKIASQIGEKSIKNKSLRENLKNLLTAENFEDGITNYITNLEGKKFKELIKSLDLTKKEYIDDIKSIFDVQYSNLWEEKGTQEEIKKLIFNYEFIKNTNFVLDTKVKTLRESFQKWNERLDFVYYSKEFFKNNCSEFSAIFDFLFDIYTEKINQANYIPNDIKNINTRLRDNLGKLKMIFEQETTREAVSNYYRKYFADFSDEVFDDFPIELLQGKRLFAKNETEVRNIVRDVLEDCQKGQENRELFEYWKAKTDTRDPREWSSIHRTPILIMLNEDEYSRGEQVFELINKKVNVMQYDLDNALDFLKNNDELFERLDNKDEINKRFAKFLGKYSVVLKDFEDVRKQLESTKIETYNWVKENPIAKKLKSIAENKYKSCRDNVIEKIKVMNEESLRKYLIKMIENNMDFGIEIMSEEE